MRLLPAVVAAHDRPRPRMAALDAPRHVTDLDPQPLTSPSTSAVVGVAPPGPSRLLEFQPVEPLNVYWYGNGGGDPEENAVSSPTLRTASLANTVFDSPSVTLRIRTREF